MAIPFLAEHGDSHLQSLISTCNYKIILLREETEKPLDSRSQIFWGVCSSQVFIYREKEVPAYGLRDFC